MHTLILRPGAVGDSLLTFAVIQKLREQDTQTRVMLVGNAAVLPLARAFRLAEEVDNYDSSRWSELFSTDGVRNPALLGQLRQFERAIGWLSDPDGIVKQNLWAAGIKTVMVSSSQPPEEKRHLHRVVYMAETVGLPPIDVTASFVSPLRTILRNAQRLSHSDNPLPAYDPAPIAVHPGSGSVNKCWPVSHFLSLVERLCSRGQPVLLLAGPADHERLAILLDALASHFEKKLLRTLVDAPLLEVAHQLLQCQCYIGNDSGITHLAALLGIPTLAIFGPSDPAHWRPLGPMVKVLRPAFPHLMEQLTVDTVMEALEPFSLTGSMPV